MTAGNTPALVAVESGRYTLSWDGKSYTVYANDNIVGGAYDVWALYDYMDGDYISETIENRVDGNVIVKLDYYVSRNGQVREKERMYVHPAKDFAFLWSENCVLDLIQVLIDECTAYVRVKWSEEHGEDKQED